MWCFTTWDDETRNGEREYLRSCSFQNMKREKKKFSGKMCKSKGLAFDFEMCDPPRNENKFKKKG